MLKINNSNFICSTCSRTFSNYDSLRKHTSRVHHIHSDQFYVSFNLNNQWPLCNCGCQQKISNPKIYITETGDWQQTYLRGHIARIKNNFQTEKSIADSLATRRQMSKDGKLIAWNKDLTKETDVRIEKYAKKLIGREITWKEKLRYPKTEKHKIALSIASRTSDKAKRAQLINIQKANKVTAFRFNKLEQFFIKKYPEYANWDRQVYIGKHLVDFANLKTKQVIEINGDYWHCNPNGKSFRWLPENFHPRLNMTAKEKWEADKKRIEEIEAAGFQVNIIWESELKI